MFKPKSIETEWSQTKGQQRLKWWFGWIDDPSFAFIDEMPEQVISIIRDMMITTITWKTFEAFIFKALFQTKHCILGQ